MTSPIKKEYIKECKIRGEVIDIYFCFLFNSLLPPNNEQ